MTTINLHLHDGTIETAEMATYNPNELLVKISDNKIFAIAAGKSVINKNSIKLIAPKHPEDKVWDSPIKVSLNDGTSYLTEDDDYDSTITSAKINNQNSHMCVIGDLIVLKSNIKLISPVTDVVED